MTLQYAVPELLDDAHVLDQFKCRSSEQTAWLLRFSRQSQASSSTKVFVVTLKDSTEVVAYYAWRMAELRAEEIPSRMAKGQGKFPQPVSLLARLGVDLRHEGNGIGAALLRDVILKMVNISDKVGCRGLLIHCETNEAKAFYRHLIPGLIESPSDPLHLYLMKKDVLALLNE